MGVFTSVSTEVSYSSTELLGKLNHFKIVYEKYDLRTTMQDANNALTILEEEKCGKNRVICIIRSDMDLN